MHINIKYNGSDIRLDREVYAVSRHYVKVYAVVTTTYKKKNFWGKEKEVTETKFKELFSTKSVDRTFTIVNIMDLRKIAPRILELMEEYIKEFGETALEGDLVINTKESFLKL